MKLTMNKLAQIIREEVKNTLTEVWRPGDDPSLRPGKASVGLSDQERWEKNSDMPYQGGGEDEEAETKLSPVKPEAKALRDFLRTVFDQPEYTWADFDNEHYMILKGVLKNSDDENREALKQAARANNLSWRNLLVDVDWIVRGYGMPKSFLDLEDALMAQG